MKITINVNNYNKGKLKGFESECEIKTISNNNHEVTFDSENRTLKHRLKCYDSQIQKALNNL